MPVFNWAESPGTSCELRASVVSTQFGDGYEASVDDGLNPVRQIWDVVIARASAEEADAIEAMVKPGLGRTRLDWTPPRQTVALKFKCTSFSRTLTDEVGVHDIRLRFEQVFGP